MFDVEARELFELFARAEPKKHRFSALEYLFPAQILTLYDADKQYDHFRVGKNARRVWGQVGLGSDDYLWSVQK